MPQVYPIATKSKWKYWFVGAGECCDEANYAWKNDETKMNCDDSDFFMKM